MITVQVCSKSSGKGISGKKVFVSFSGITRGFTEAYTDSNGDAHLNADPGYGEVYVGGNKVHQGHLSGRVVVYI